jgi:hypothetical protein
VEAEGCLSFRLFSVSMLLDARVSSEHRIRTAAEMLPSSIFALTAEAMKYLLPTAKEGLLIKSCSSETPFSRLVILFLIVEERLCLLPALAGTCRTRLPKFYRSDQLARLFGSLTVLRKVPAKATAQKCLADFGMCLIVGRVKQGCSIKFDGIVFNTSRFKLIR